MAMTTVDNQISRFNANRTMFDGKPIARAVIMSQKGRGKVRPRWQGRPEEVCLAVWRVGAIINDGTKWLVGCEVAEGQMVVVSLDDFLSTTK